MADDQQWYVMVGGKEQGPYDKDRLKTLARQGKIRAQTKVRLAGKGWIAAAKIKGLLPRQASRQHQRKPAPKRTVLVRSGDEVSELSSQQLEQAIEQDSVPFDRPVVSVDGGANWLRPAEALLAVEQGVEVAGAGDPSRFDAFADHKITVFEKDVKAVSSQQQHGMVGPWQGLGLGWIVCYFVPVWLGLHETWSAWNMGGLAGGAFSGVGVLMATYLLLGIALFPISRFAKGRLRGILIAGLGAIALLVSGALLFLVDHGAPALTAGPLPLLIFSLAIALAVMSGGNYLRAYFPGSEVARLLSGISAVVYLILAVITIFLHLGDGWFGYGLAQQPYWLWITSLAFWGLLGLSGLAAVLAAAGLAGRGEGAEVRANMAHIWATRAMLSFLLWLAIVPIWIYGAGLTEPDGMGFVTFLMIELAVLRGIVYLGGACFLFGTGIVDAVQDELLRRDAARKQAALAAAKQQRRGKE